MSQENEPGGAPTSGEPSVVSSTSTPPPERKRTSLKALAEKASQAGPRSSVAPSSSAARAPTSTPVPSAPSASVRPAATSTPLSRPKEAGADDSGVINLHVVRAAATPQQIADAEKAKPASEGLFDDDKAVAANEAPAKKSADVIPIAVKAPPKKGNGPVVGLVIAVLGVAAAVAIMQTRKTPQAPVASTDTKPAVTTVAKPPPAETAAPTAVAAATAEATAAPSAEPEKSDTPKVAGGPLPNSGAGSTAATAAPKDAPPDDGKVAAAPKSTAPTGKPGDLQSEIARAAGADGKPKDNAGDGTPEPAAGNPKTQNIPEQPSQGAVASAVGGVMGGAKSCVSGADDVSRANVTFSSNGSVSNVSVTGWAAAHGKSACVTAALKGAKVGPFSKPSFTFPVTIRP